MKRWLKWGLIAGLTAALALVACNPESSGDDSTPQMTEESFNQSLSDFSDTASEVLQEAASEDLAFVALEDLLTEKADSAGSSVALAAAKLIQLSQLGSVSASDVRGLIEVMPASQELPRGKFDWNGSDWVEDGGYTGDNLEINWPFEDAEGVGHLARIVVDWSDGLLTIDAKDGDGDLVEVPVRSKVSYYIDGSIDKGGYIKGAFTWYNGSCGTILEPSSLALEGHIGSTTTLDFNIDLTVGSSSIATTGDIKLESAGGSEGGQVKWNVSIKGNIERGSDCFINNVDTESGSVNFFTSATHEGETESFEFNTAFVIKDNEDGTPSEIEISEGYVKVNGETAFTFEGVLDDADEDGVPGENVTVHFADGDTDLEQVLRDNGFGPPATP